MSEPNNTRGLPGWAVAVITLGAVAVIVAVCYAAFVFWMMTAKD